MIDMFTPVDPAIKEKVISAYLTGHKGRNQIARELHEQGLKISSGSISNIISAYKRTQQSLEQNKKPLQKNTESLPDNASISTDVSSNITVVSPLRQNHIEVTPRNGGPLSHLLLEDISTDEEKPEPNDLADSHPINIEPEDNIISQDVTSENDTIEEEKKEYRSQTPLSDPEDTSIESRSGIDWDSQIMWERKLIRAWGERSQQIQLIENGKRELAEEREQVESMKETVRLEMNNLKAEKAEVEPQIPLARQLQIMKVDVGNFMPWSEIVRRYAVNHNVDLTTAAFDIKKKLEAYGELEFIKKEIKKAEAYWSALCETIRDDQRAIADLKYLRLAGCGKRDLKKLGEIIRGQRLDDELISKEELGAIGYRINGKKIRPCGTNLQQPGSNNPTSLSNNGAQQPNNDSPDLIANNGHNDPSMRRRRYYYLVRFFEKRYNMTLSTAQALASTCGTVKIS